MASTALGLALRHIHRLFDGGSVAHLSDARLLERFAGDRDPAAFEGLVARHGPMVLAVCRAVLGDEHDAEDAFQATFLILARKAGSLRVGDTLGGWLYRVAFRAAVQADRAAARLRAREKEATAMAAIDTNTSTTTESGHDAARADVRRVLHEEIDRLPERHRLPVVLCYLEGLSYEQAAVQLRATVPALRCWLARARERLKARLTRRGITGAGAVLTALLSTRSSTAAVPPSWVRSAVAAAVAGTSASGGAALLAQGMMRSMLVTRMVTAAVPTLALAALAGVAAGWQTGGSARTGVPSIPASPPVARAPALKPAAAAPQRESPGETVTVRGRVVGPTGAPVQGATIRLDYYMYRKPPEGGEPTAASGPDGRFTLEAPRKVIDAFTLGEWNQPVRIVASAPGCGPSSAEQGTGSDALKDVTIRLAADDRPIEGRVLDLEGRPVAGAVFTTEEVGVPKEGGLDAWVDAMKAHPRQLHETLDMIPLKVKRTTGPDGRFRIDGVGRDRVVQLTVIGPTVAITRTFAMTADRPAFTTPNVHIIAPETLAFHAARFDYVAAPSRPVGGTVRDLDSGKPLAGVRVQGMVYEDRSSVYYHEVASTTDDRGRYELPGLAAADKYRLFVFPGKGMPYTTATFVEPVGHPGIEPATIDLRLKRGVLVRGRVTDRVTGKPVKGRVESYALRDNPHAKDYPGHINSYPPNDYPDEGGHYEVAALPGDGVIAFRAEADRYLKGVGAETIKGVKPGQRIIALSGSFSPEECHAIAAIDPEPGADVVTCDLQVDPGRTLSGTVLDPDGKPLAGVTARGVSARFRHLTQQLDSAAFELFGLDPRQPRRVEAFHEGRELAGAMWVRGDETGPIVLRLQPWGVITGRALDEEGEPLTNLDLVAFQIGESEPERGFLFKEYRIDRDGRFRVEVVPGLIYTAHAVDPVRNQGVRRVFKDVKVGPGEAKELGDVRATRGFGD
jgi:RNA polymerase sigma factor (sigma-70 family)